MKPGPTSGRTKRSKVGAADPYRGGGSEPISCGMLEHCDTRREDLQPLWNSFEPQYTRTLAHAKIVSDPSRPRTAHASFTLFFAPVLEAGPWSLRRSRRLVCLRWVIARLSLVVRCLSAVRLFVVTRILISLIFSGSGRQIVDKVTVTLPVLLRMRLNSIRPLCSNSLTFGPLPLPRRFLKENSDIV